MRRNPIRIGLIGAARIAPRAVIVPAAASPDAEVVAVAARSFARAQALAAEHGLAKAAGSYEEIVADPSVDLVYVALPVSLHAAWTEAALRGGKAVLCEKPFARDAAEARHMVDCAARRGRPLLEAFHYRFHAAFREVERLVASGALGRLSGARASFLLPLLEPEDDIRWNPDLGGALADLGCYPVHALRTLLGREPEIVEAESRLLRGVDARTAARLRFGDIVAHMSCAMDATEPEATLVLEGEAGWLKLENFVAPQMGHRLTVNARGTESVQTLEGPDSYTAQLGHVVAVMRNETAPLTGGADAIATMAALDAIRGTALAA